MERDGNKKLRIQPKWGERMAIIKEFVDNNCRIYINDDYFVKTLKDANKILEAVSIIYSRYFFNFPETNKGKDKNILTSLTSEGET